MQISRKIRVKFFQGKINHILQVTILGAIAIFLTIACSNDPVAKPCNMIVVKLKSAINLKRSWRLDPIC
jgi:hypothetical protein